MLRRGKLRSFPFKTYKELDDQLLETLDLLLFQVLFFILLACHSQVKSHWSWRNNRGSGKPVGSSQRVLCGLE